jgi:hypothetical protein
MMVYHASGFEYYAFHMAGVIAFAYLIWKRF